MRRLEVEFVSPSCAYVRGYGSRDLITELRGRPPVWATLSHAWVVQPSTARDVIAAAEARGYEIFVSGDTKIFGNEKVGTRSSPSVADRDVRRGDDQLDPGRGLW